MTKIEKDSSQDNEKVAFTDYNDARWSPVDVR